MTDAPPLIDNAIDTLSSIISFLQTFLENNQNMILPLIAICFSLFAISIAIYLYFMTKVFMLKEYDAKEGEAKRETMRSWVHENLIEDVYTPLAEHALAISYTLSQKRYGEDVVLYRISKFLRYIFKNRRIFGGDMYFTPHESSNRLLETISERITSEINTIYDIQDDKNPTERRTVILEFIAACAKSKNYSEFRLLISGRSIANKDLTDEIGRLMDEYSNDHYLPRRYGDHSSIFLDPINELINPQNLGQAWIRAKLYAYCNLFNKLLMYEIHQVYDSWYVEHPDTPKHHQLFDVIDLVEGIVTRMDRLLERDRKRREEFYSKSRADEIDTKLNILKKSLSSVTDPNAEEIKQQMKRLESELESERVELEHIEFQHSNCKSEMSKSIELLHSISSQRDKVLKKNKSREFYKTVMSMKILGRLPVIYHIRIKDIKSDIKSGWWAFRMIISLKIRNSRLCRTPPNDP